MCAESPVEKGLSTRDKKKANPLRLSINVPGRHIAPFESISQADAVIMQCIGAEKREADIVGAHGCHSHRSVQPGTMPAD